MARLSGVFYLKVATGHRHQSTLPRIELILHEFSFQYLVIGYETDQIHSIRKL
jgi:hypothetical protein